jgi:murein DD-endopeptidase MepM/ murein hydrolase activator NlpD
MRQPQRRDAAATEVAQADPNAAAETPPAAAPAPEPAPIVEAPLGSAVAPPVNRRPGGEAQPAPTPPAVAPVTTPSRRASRSRTLPPASVARPLVAGRVESVNDTSHTVEVEKGDTVNTISDGLMTPKDSLIKLNKLHKPYELEIGRELKIPVHKVYVVQAGDSLYGIARRFSSPVDVLSDINRLDAKSRLRPGQKIALPELAKDTGPVANPRESATELARADDTPSPPSRPSVSDAAPSESLASASSSSRVDPYAPPSAPRPYASVSPRPPSRSAYPQPSAPSTFDTAPSVSDGQIQVAGRGRFVWPVRGNLLSNYGPKPGGQRNDGVDIAAPDHAAVHAAASGDVVYAGDQIPGFGNLVLIKHEGGWVTAYAHLSLSEVKIKEHVSQGDEIGQVGVTGGVAEPQLHFEIRYAASPHDKARPIDPALVLSGLSDQ